jgi:uncharacterized membrane protein YtjA (UPF0391 family)
MRRGNVVWSEALPRSYSQEKGPVMLKWAIIFAIIAVIAGALGFTGVAGAAAVVAKFLFFIFLVVCVICLVLGFTIAKKI